jgi:putative chitinase
MLAGYSFQDYELLESVFLASPVASVTFNNLNQYADNNDILTMTKRINGGTIGLEDRMKHYAHALHVFGGH